MLVACLAPAVAAAAAGEEVELDGMLYRVDAEGNAVLVGPLPGTSPRGGALVIPAVVTADDSVAHRVTAVGDSAFASCPWLTALSVPVTLKHIGTAAFASCHALSGWLVLPQGMESVGEAAFKGCSSLRGVSLPSTLSHVAADAFDGCDGMEQAFSHLAAAQEFLARLPLSTRLCADTAHVAAHAAATGRDVVGMVDVDSSGANINPRDVNRDGIVNAADVIMVYNTIIGDPLAPAGSSDVNGDGAVNAADVTLIYSAILAGNTSGVGDEGYCFARVNAAGWDLSSRLDETVEMPVGAVVPVVAWDGAAGSIMWGATRVMSGATPRVEYHDDGPLVLANDRYCTQTVTPAVLYFEHADGNIYYKDIALDISRHTVTDTLRVLSVGNSFAFDALSYVPQVMKAVAPQVYLELGVMYIGGGGLSDFYNALDSTTHAPVKEGIATGFEYYRCTYGGKWEKASDRHVPMSEVLRGKPWDVVVMQQVSSLSRDYDSYQPYLDMTMRWIDSVATGPHSYAWLITPSYPDNLPRLAPDTSSVQMFERIAAAAGRVQREAGIDLLLPCGTAIQNARTTSLSTLGDRGQLFEDLHLQDGMPCLIEAYAATAALLARYGLSDRVYADTTWVDEAWLKRYNIEEVNGQPVGMSEENRAIAKRCVAAAMQQPLEITKIEE